ncbi:MAG: WD40 repeat domain-containing protein [Anaerolineae bacterium]|nr:WD40 repeat domain-containing protein [Anaerolineae bacterium]
MTSIFHNETRKMPLAAGTLLIVLALLITSCQSEPAQQVNATETVQAALDQAATDINATAAVPPTATVTTAPTITPVPTRVPPTATPELPVAVATLIPFNDEIISVENASDLAPLALYGRGTIEEIAMTPSGRWVVVATISGISIYDINDPNNEVLFLANQSVRSVDVSANGEYLAAGLQDGRLVIMEMADGMILQDIDAHQGAVLAVDISPDGMLIASGDDNGIVSIWNTSTGAMVSTFDDHIGRVNDLTFSPDNKTLASGSSDTLVYLWDVQAGTKKATLRGQTGSITTLEYTANGQYLASGSADTTTYLWNLSEEEPYPFVIPNPDIVRDVAFSPNMQQLAIAGDDNQVYVWEVFDAEYNYQGYQVLSLPHNYIVKSIAYGSENTLVSATWGSVISWWQLPDRELLLSIDRGQLISAGYLGDRPYIIAEPLAGDVQLYYADTGEEIITLENTHNNSVYDALLLDGGEKLLTVSYDGYRLWNLTDGSMTQEFTGNTSFVTALDVSGDGKLLAIGWGNGAVDVLDMESYEVTQSIRHGIGRVLTLDFSPDGSLLASAGDDADIRLWRLTDGDELLEITGHQDVIYDVQFSPNGERLASASSDYTVRLWQSITGDEADWGKQLNLFDEHDFRVKGVTFSPAGDVLASVSDDGTVNVWALSGGQLLATLRGLTGYAKEIGFHPDGALMYTDDWDGVMRIFGIPPIFE